jgi:hypothetical protein
MFAKVSEVAERLATRVSRRSFLGRLGKGALALAGALGGVLAFSSDARAGRPLYVCCNGVDRGYYCGPPNKGCTPISLTCSGCVWRCGGGKILTSACA